jgi:hypothetical protein
MATVCESCLQAADEEVSPNISSVREMSEFMVDMGADVSDHLCDQLESGGDIQCACACHPVRLFASWKGKAKDLTFDVVADVYNRTRLDRNGKPMVG